MPRRLTKQGHNWWTTFLKQHTGVHSELAQFYQDDDQPMIDFFWRRPLDSFINAYVLRDRYIEEARKSLVELDEDSAFPKGIYETIGFVGNQAVFEWINTIPPENEETEIGQVVGMLSSEQMKLLVSYLIYRVALFSSRTLLQFGEDAGYEVAEQLDRFRQENAYLFETSGNSRKLPAINPQDLKASNGQGFSPIPPRSSGKKPPFLKKASTQPVVNNLIVDDLRKGHQIDVNDELRNIEDIYRDPDTREMYHSVMIGDNLVWVELQNFRESSKFPGYLVGMIYGNPLASQPLAPQIPKKAPVTKPITDQEIEQLQGSEEDQQAAPNAPQSSVPNKSGQGQTTTTGSKGTSLKPKPKLTQSPPQPQRQKTEEELLDEEGIVDLYFKKNLRNLKRQIKTDSEFRKVDSSEKIPCSGGSYIKRSNRELDPREIGLRDYIFLGLAIIALFVEQQIKFGYTGYSLLSNFFSYKIPWFNGWGHALELFAPMVVYLLLGFFLALVFVVFKNYETKEKTKEAGHNTGAMMIYTLVILACAGLISVAFHKVAFFKAFVEALPTDGLWIFAPLSQDSYMFWAVVVSSLVFSGSMFRPRSPLLSDKDMGFLPAFFLFLLLVCYLFTGGSILQLAGICLGFEGAFIIGIMVGNSPFGSILRFVFRKKPPVYYERFFQSAPAQPQQQAVRPGQPNSQQPVRPGQPNQQQPGK